MPCRSSTYFPACLIENWARLLARANRQIYWLSANFERRKVRTLKNIRLIEKQLQARFFTRDESFARRRIVHFVRLSCAICRSGDFSIPCSKMFLSFMAENWYLRQQWNFITQFWHYSLHHTCQIICFFFSKIIQRKCSCLIFQFEIDVKLKNRQRDRAFSFSRHKLEQLGIWNHKFEFLKIKVITFEDIFEKKPQLLFGQL